MVALAIGEVSYDVAWFRLSSTVLASKATA